MSFLAIQNAGSLMPTPSGLRFIVLFSAALTIVLIM